MATMLDHQLGVGIESTYNTPVTVDRFYEWLPGSGIEWDPAPIQGKGLRVGSQVARAGRRAAGIGTGSGKLNVELLSKGFGRIFKAALGTGASTLVSGTTYQQLFTPAMNGTYLDSLTIQEGIVKPGGSVDTYTYAGCTVKSLEIDVSPGDPVKCAIDVDAMSMATGTALATASYPSSPTLYTGALPASGQGTFGGTLTVPTSTALGSVSGGTAAVGLRSWTLSVENDADTKREKIGGRNQPTIGEKKLKLKTVVEYDATTGTVFRDAYTAQTTMSILLAVTTPEALSTGTAQLQVAIPAAAIDKGAIPQPSDGKIVTTSLEWEILDPLTAAPLYVVLRTADSAL